MACCTLSTTNVHLFARPTIASRHADAKLCQLRICSPCIQWLWLEWLWFRRRLPPLIALICLHAGMHSPTIHPLYTNHTGSGFAPSQIGQNKDTHAASFSALNDWRFSHSRHQAQSYPREASKRRAFSQIERHGQAGSPPNVAAF